MCIMCTTLNGALYLCKIIPRRKQFDARMHAMPRLRFQRRARHWTCPDDRQRKGFEDSLNRRERRPIPSLEYGQLQGVRPYGIKRSANYPYQVLSISPPANACRARRDDSYSIRYRAVPAVRRRFRGRSSALAYAPAPSLNASAISSLDVLLLPPLISRTLP